MRAGLPGSLNCGSRVSPDELHQGFVEAYHRAIRVGSACVQVGDRSGPRLWDRSISVLRPLWFPCFTLPWAMSCCPRTPRRMSGAPSPDGGARHCRPEVAAQSRASRGHALVSVQIHFLVLHTPPQPFHEDVVHPSPLAVADDSLPNLSATWSSVSPFRCALPGAFCPIACAPEL